MRDNDIFLIVIIISIILASYFQLDWKNGSFKTIKEKQNESKTVMTSDGKVAPTTILNEQQMKIQQETGCFANCHKDMK